jgi:hypothetical protein
MFMVTYTTPLPCHELTDTIIGIYYSVLSTFSAPRGVPERAFRDVFAQRLKQAHLKVEVEKTQFRITCYGISWARDLPSVVPI